ncbi:MAG: hypothetical protein LBG60_06845 [Bifidobacteriaceae bacterium]|nr:hypothetical protein [Bifidobacteriaceae bacterium]
MRQLAQGTNGLVLDGTDGKLAEAVDQAIAAALDNPLAWIQGPYVVKSGEELTLDAGGSYSPYGGITAYEWDFEGDGIWDQTTDSWTVTHRFDEEFDGVVGVRVTDARGRRAIGSTQLLVTDDGDSAARDVDNCPDVYNWGQEDSDGDGVGDECDATPGAAIWEPADDGAVFTKAQVEALTQTGSPSNPEPSAPVGPEPSIAPSGSQGDGSREPSAPAAVPSAGATGVVSASQSSSPAPAGSRASGQDGSPGPSGADGPVSAGPLPLTGALSPGWLPASVAASLIFGALLVVFRRRRARQGLMGG